jgi:hypothetical protein
MNKKRLLLVTGIVAASARLMAADIVTFSDRVRYERDVDKFGPNEGTVDLFGTYATRDRFGVKGDHWGGGLGVNWFITRNIGLGVDSYLEEWKWPYRVNGSLILRAPIEQLSLAPYVFGGGGRQYKYVPQWTAHAGVGLEFRLNRHTGFFADGRRIFPEDTPDYTLARAGLRLGW